MGVAPPYTPLWKIKGKIESHAMLIVNLSEKKFGAVLSGENSHQDLSAAVAGYHNIESAQNVGYIFFTQILDLR